MAQGHRTFGATNGGGIKRQQPAIDFLQGRGCHGVQRGALQAGNGVIVERME